MTDEEGKALSVLIRMQEPGEFSSQEVLARKVRRIPRPDMDPQREVKAGLGLGLSELLKLSWKKDTLSKYVVEVLHSTEKTLGLTEPRKLSSRPERFLKSAVRQLKRD